MVKHLSWSTGLSFCKQQGPSSHLLPTFFITEAPSQHLKGDLFHKLSDQRIPGTDWQSSVMPLSKTPYQPEGLRGAHRTQLHPQLCCPIVHGTHAPCGMGQPRPPACTQQTLLWPEQPDPKLCAHRIYSLKEASAASYALLQKHTLL